LSAPFRSVTGAPERQPILIGQAGKDVRGYCGSELVGQIAATRSTLFERDTVLPSKVTCFIYLAKVIPFGPDAASKIVHWAEWLYRLRLALVLLVPVPFPGQSIPARFFKYM